MGIIRKWRVQGWVEEEEEEEEEWKREGTSGKRTCKQVFLFLSCCFWFGVACLFTALVCYRIQWEREREREKRSIFCIVFWVLAKIKQEWGLGKCNQKFNNARKSEGFIKEPENGWLVWLVKTLKWFLEIWSVKCKQETKHY